MSKRNGKMKYLAIGAIGLIAAGGVGSGYNLPDSGAGTGSTHNLWSAKGSE